MLDVILFSSFLSLTAETDFNFSVKLHFTMQMLFSFDHQTLPIMKKVRSACIFKVPVIES